MQYIKFKIIIALICICLNATAMTCSEATGVIISASEKKLILCENGQLVKQFYIAIGQGGVGKMRLGDRKTPLGDYFLERPHISTRFGLFIPIDYPTRQQKALGYTGYAIGIHGPLRANRWLGRYNTRWNWTDGCIAVASDKEIMQIAMWTQAHRLPIVKIIE